MNSKKNLKVFGSQAAQTLFVIYIRDSIALYFEPFKRMYENGSPVFGLALRKGGSELIVEKNQGGELWREGFIRSRMPSIVGETRE